MPEHDLLPENNSVAKEAAKTFQAETSKEEAPEPSAGEVAGATFSRVSAAYADDLVDEHCS